jgi:hypothetical protein
MSVVGRPVQYLDPDGNVLAATITAIEATEHPLSFPIVTLAVLPPDSHHVIVKTGVKYWRNVPPNTPTLESGCWRDIA